MKKFFLIAAAAALVLSSCSKNNVSENTSESNLIGFSSYTGRSVTKADGSFVPSTSPALPSNGAFGVYCYNSGNTDFTTESTIAPNFMSNVPVTYNGSGKDDAANYTYMPTRYWPSDGANNKLSFYAYYPHGGAGIAPTVTSGLGSYLFTVQSAIANQVDFMLSDLVANQTYTSNSAKNGQVDLQFHHMLTQVRFLAKTDKDYNNGTQEQTTIIITGLQLTGVNSVATLTAKNQTWGAATTPNNFTVLMASDVAKRTLTTAAKDFTANNDTPNSETLLMVPQTIPTTAQLVVTFTYQTTGMTEPVTETKTIPLSTSRLTAWAKNQNIVYTISLGLKAITFTATVSNWEDETSIAL
jgi:hypothetical protein